ncbi:zinc ribbon domain-containing protein, partial [Methanosphaera sp.]|uniref:zinc ribbon domain-containing protein n=1 Tax=Methanosphaera sp. TaxID=2666342 RepID=UPI002E7A7AB4
MFCKKCGSEISESNETCPKCGTFLNDKFATEEYDPLLALDKVENVEDNVIWQEAPLGDDAIILNAENVEKSSEPLIKESNVDGSFVEEAVEKIENEENNYKGSVAQGLRAAKSTIAHPIKPRKRIKPKSEPSKPENSQVIEAPIEKTNIEHSESVESIVEEVPQMEETIPVSDTMETNIIEETVVEEVEVPKETVVEEEVPVVDVVEEEVVVTDDFNNSSVNDDEVIDIFDDFVVDDSIVILDETPEIIEEVPEVEETTQVPEVEETTQVPEVEVPKETIVEEVPVVQEEVVEEAMIVDDVV